MISPGVLAWFGVWFSFMVSAPKKGAGGAPGGLIEGGLNGAAPTTGGIFTPSGFVAVVFPASNVKNMAHIIGAGRRAYIIMFGKPSAAGAGVKGDCVARIYGRAGAATFARIAGGH